MRAPRPVNTAIDARRIRKWVGEYGGYRHAVTNITIESWLDQFRENDRDLAARILDAVDFYGQDRIAAGFRRALSSIPGWNRDRRRLRGRWRFAAFSQSAGESGDSMLHQFRLANGMDGRAYRDMFIHTSDLVRQELRAKDTVVMVDDMTATGDQVCRAWREFFAELVAGAGRVFLLVVVAGRAARDRIAEETELSLVPVQQMENRDGFFSNECVHFPAAEKDKILEYSRTADPTHPRGYGDCAYLLVFQHRCPNNSLPILHRSHAAWEGIFPRHD